MQVGLKTEKCANDFHVQALCDCSMQQKNRFYFKFKLPRVQPCSFPLKQSFFFFLSGDQLGHTRSTF